MLGGLSTSEKPEDRPARTGERCAPPSEGVLDGRREWLAFEVAAGSDVPPPEPSIRLEAELDPSPPALCPGELAVPDNDTDDVVGSERRPPSMATCKARLTITDIGAPLASDSSTSQRRTSSGTRMIT